jgi:beta-glucosidase
MVTDLGDIIVAKGKYTVSIGSGQPASGVPSVSGNLEIKGQIVLPE